jgi:hypothetical protein
LEVGFSLKASHASREFACGNIQKLLRDLSADNARTIGERALYERLRDTLLPAICRIEAIDEDVSIQKVLSAHSIHREKTFYRWKHASTVASNDRTRQHWCLCPYNAEATVEKRSSKLCAPGGLAFSRLQ